MDYFITIATNVVTAAFVLIAGWFIGHQAEKAVHRIKRLDGTLQSFLGVSARYAVLAISLVMVLQEFGVETASLLAVLGAAGLAIGLALQGTLSNVAAGVMLLMLRPFNVGDFISAGGVMGTVKSLDLFATKLARPDGVFVFVPNSQIWNKDIENFSRNETRRMDIVNGISYDDDINKAMKTIEKAIAKDDRIIRGEEGKEPQIMVTSLGDSSVNITLRLWANTSDYWALQWDTIKAVKEALDKSGITIPFPTRTLEMVEPPTEAPKSKKKAA